MLASLSGYLVLIHSLVLAAGLLGRLTTGGLAVLLAVTAGVALWLVRRARIADGATRDGPTTASRLAALAGIVTLGLWVWPHLAHATRLWIWDDYTYHLVYPALWLGEHAIGAPDAAHAFTMQAWYPLSASVVATWFMVPFAGSRADALTWVSLTGVLYAGIVASGAATLLARAGCRPGAWAVPIVLFATSPRIGIMASSFSDADLAMASTIFGALAFAVPRGFAEEASAVRVDAAYAGLLTGLALGVKVSAAPLALIVLVVLALRARAHWPSVALIVLGAWTVMAGYWYLRNVAHHGNPVYPAAFLVWPGTRFPETTLLEYARHYGVGRTLTDALVVYADWPRFHAALAVVGLVGLLAWWVVRRAPATRAQRYFASGALALASVIVVMQPAAPYSAGNSMTFRSGFIHWDSMRYVALVPILGWVALGFDVDTLGRRWTARATDRARTTVRERPSLPPRWRVAVIGAAALVLGVIVVGWHGPKAAATASAFSREPLYGAVVDVLDRQPAGTRVAIFGDQWTYPTFGARHHLRPLRLDGNGRLATGPVADAMEPGELTVDPATLRANLAAAGVDVVVVLHLPHPGRSAEWPVQHAAIEAFGDARLLQRNAWSAVWRLTSSRP